VPDDKDYDESIRKPIRRLHPERERAKAIKKLQEQRAHKAVPKADPWDTSDEAWGTVEVVPVAVTDSVSDDFDDTSLDEGGRHVTTAQGRRLSSGNATSKSAADKAQLDALLNADYSIKQYEAPGARRMTWRDEPVTATRDQLEPFFDITATRCLPRGIGLDTASNEAFFYFDLDANGHASGPLRLRVQYCADDPLDFDELVFNVDGHDYVFFPRDMRQGTIGKMYWQTSDDDLRAVDRDLAYALSHSHWMMLKLKGSNGISHVKMLTDSQRDDFARALQFYRLLGGSL